MGLSSLVRLPGPYTQVKDLPQQCSCGCKELFIQADFKRSIGLAMVTIASVITVILATQGFGWFVIWSPFFIALIIDRVLAATNPVAVICYKCEHIYRGVPKEAAIKNYESFDLEVHDRHKYAERISETQ